MSEMPSVYRMINRVARKAHKCCECRGVIEMGETYHYHSGVWEGDPASFKVCIDCDALRNQFAKDCELDMDEVPGFGCLGGDVEEYHRDLFEAIKKKRRATPTAEATP